MTDRKITNQLRKESMNLFAKIHSESIEVAITFTEPLLGSMCSNPDVYKEFLEKKVPTAEKAAEELKTIEEAAALAEQEIEKTKTTFARDEEGLFMWDYQIRGFFKEAMTNLIEMGVCGVSRWQVKRMIDSYLIITPRRCYFFNDDEPRIEKPTGSWDRPLRASTRQGERICLVSSDTLKPGTMLRFTVKILRANKGPTLQDALECLEYGALKGMLQWRGGGFGRFTFGTSNPEEFVPKKPKPAGPENEETQPKKGKE